MILLLVGLAFGHGERGADRGPVAWALGVTGKIARHDGTWLDAGEAIEPGARFELPVGAAATVAHNGRIVRWEGPGTVRVGADAARMNLAGQIVRWPHVEDMGNSLTGEVRVPAMADQAVTALGVPRTAAAWARQDAIDGGQLHGLYRDRLRARLDAAQVDPKLVAELGLTEALAGDVGEQVALVGGYFDLARATPSAALLLEVHPTHTDLDVVSANLSKTLFDSVVGMRPHTFRVGPEVDKIRTYGLDVADSLRRSGHAVFALVVPYANTMENIFARAGRPDDGVENLHQLLVRAGGLEGELRTVAFGYSQGATVVERYVARYGDSDGLDAAIALAAMGGADGAGGEGVWAGTAGRVRADGVPLLAVVHPGDPARWLFGRSTIGMAPALANFAQGGRPRGQDGRLHGTYHGSHATPILPGGDKAAALEAGCHGYPTAYLAPMYDDLFGGRYPGELRRRGEWTFDTRVELTGLDRGDFATTRRSPREVADAYVDAVIRMEE